MKNFIGNTLLVVGSATFILGLAEVATRIVAPTLPAEQRTLTAHNLKGILEFDDRLETRYRPGSSTVVSSPYGEFEIEYSINDLGVRDRPLETLAGKREVRVLALGNSFAEGWGVTQAESFLSVAETQMNASQWSIAGKSVRFICAGVSGYGAAQSYLLFQELFSKVHPDVVVFLYVSTMVNADRDFLSRADLDSRHLATGLNVDALLAPTSREAEKGPLGDDSPAVRWLTGVSMLAHFVVARIDSYMAVQRVEAGNPESDLLAGIRAERSLLADLHRASLHHILAIAEQVRSAGKMFLLVHLPMPHQVSATAWGEGRTAYGLEEKLYDAPDRAVVETFCARNTLNCVAAHDYLTSLSAEREEAIYYRYDFHLNPAGNEALGSWLAERVEALLQ